MSASETIDAIIAIPVVLIFAYVMLWWFGTFVRFFTYELYRHYRYTMKGLCPNRRCHKPLERTVRPVDQLYGPTQIIESVCTCGSNPLPIGDRRFADWADY